MPLTRFHLLMVCAHQSQCQRSVHNANIDSRLHLKCGCLHLRRGLMNPEAMDLPRLECPPQLSRYEPLQQPPSEGPGIQYFLALGLREVLPLLPRLMGRIVETLHFLGPKACAVSILEENSPDSTGDVLGAVRQELESPGHRLLPIERHRPETRQPHHQTRRTEEHSPSATAG